MAQERRARERRKKEIQRKISKTIVILIPLIAVIALFIAIAITSADSASDTDSDSAGFLIRNYLKSCIAPDKIKHAYIPDIFGKEPRKTSYSKEGKLGVEGIEKQLLINALEKAGVVVHEETTSESKECVRQVTKQDFFEWGLTGRDDSNKKRKQLLKQLKLPEHLTANAMIDAINSFMSYEACLLHIQRLNQQGE